MPETQKPQDERLPRRARKLTHFVCRELLYDYMIGRLDDDRRLATEAYLSISPELQEELELMKEASEYCKKLSATSIATGYLQNLKNIKPVQEVFVNRVKWQSWPDLLKWSMEALAVSLVVVLVAMFVPWDKIEIHFPRGEAPVILAEIEEEQMAIAGAEAKKALAEAEAKKASLNPESKLAADETSPSDKKADKKVAVAETEKTNAPTVNSSIENEQPAVAAGNAKTPDLKTGQIANAIVAARVESTATLNPPKPAPVEAKTDKKSALAQKGMLYRMMMTLDGVDSITPELRDKIIELGGERAGEVELGWRKTNPKGSYFHFSLPTTNYDTLVKTLDQYGPVRIYKNPHERVMPPGQFRIILWIEDKTQ